MNDFRADQSVDEKYTDEENAIDDSRADEEEPLAAHEETVTESMATFELGCPLNLTVIANLSPDAKPYDPQVSYLMSKNLKGSLTPGRHAFIFQVLPALVMSLSESIPATSSATSKVAIAFKKEGTLCIKPPSAESLEPQCVRARVCMDVRVRVWV